MMIFIKYKKNFATADMGIGKLSTGKTANALVMDGLLPGDGLTHLHRHNSPVLASSVNLQ